MSLTKKHFEAIANIIDNQTLFDNKVPDCGHAVHKLGLVESLADLFSEDNSRFNRDRFYQACGYEQGCSNPY